MCHFPNPHLLTSHTDTHTHTHLMCSSPSLGVSLLLDVKTNFSLPLKGKVVLVLVCFSLVAGLKNNNNKIGEGVSSNTDKLPPHKTKQNKKLFMYPILPIKNTDVTYVDNACSAYLFKFDTRQQPSANVMCALNGRRKET